MCKTNIIVTAKQKESSLTRYVLRVKEDARLHDDIVDYVTKHDISMEKLVDKLLGNHFPLLRQTDL